MGIFFSTYSNSRWGTKFMMERDVSNKKLFNEIKYLTISGNYEIAELPPNLIYLRCHESTISTLPPLPQKLKELYIYKCENMTQLPPLPDSLIKLYCEYCKLISIPPLPKNLQKFSCMDNELNQLPELPDALLELYCENNKILCLPNSLPPKLIRLDCSNNRLLNLPPLPNSLQTLRCQENEIARIIAPENLQSLWCYGNKLDNDNLSFSKKLKRLNCHSNLNLTKLPPVPTKLEWLRCSSVQFFSLENISKLKLTGLCINDHYIDEVKDDCDLSMIKEIEYLYITNTKFQISKFPSKIKYLSIITTSINSIPTLPNNLIRLTCSDNRELTHLPVIPPRLQQLLCDDNNLMELPSLPDSVKIIWCDYNQITEISNCPAELLELYCDHNQLETLPCFNDKLRYVSCNDNKLTVLPEFPEELSYIDCSNNQLIELPYLNDKLQYLYCSNNELTELPDLPFELISVDCSNNQLSRLPKIPVGLDIRFDYRKD